jgi:hypothetical protein
MFLQQAVTQIFTTGLQKSSFYSIQALRWITSLGVVRTPNITTKHWNKLESFVHAAWFEHCAVDWTALNLNQPHHPILAYVPPSPLSCLPSGPNGSLAERRRTLLVSSRLVGSPARQHLNSVWQCDVLNSGFGLLGGTHHGSLMEWR